MCVFLIHECNISGVLRGRAEGADEALLELELEYSSTLEYSSRVLEYSESIGWSGFLDLHRLHSQVWKLLESVPV